MAPSLVAQIRRINRSREYASAHHRYLRKQLAPIVAAGMTRCADSGRRIKPGEPWDLAHDRTDRSRYAGPSHARGGCNRHTAGSVIERRSGRW
jgi:hypothetical protein